MGLFTSFQLKSRDPETRRRAALKLGVPGKASAIAALQPLLTDPEWPVREAAVQALGVVADPAVVPLLVETVRAADEFKAPEAAGALRRAAVEGLGRVGAPAVPALLDALRDRHARLRESAIEALGAIGGADSVAALIAALADDRSNVRQAAAPALGRAAGEGAVEPLRAALAHKDPGTRRAAAVALGAVGAAAVAEALRVALRDRDRGVRDAAVASLVTLASPAAAAALCAALLEGDRELKPVAATALKAFAWEPADASQRIVHAVLNGRFAEAAAEGKAAVGPLLAALADRDPATRAGAATALASVPTEPGLAALAALLSDQEASVRDAAVTALGRVGTAAAVHLARALGDRGGVARAAAARAIAAIGEGAVVAALLEPLRAGQPASHAGLSLRLVHDREALDAARVAADYLAMLLAESRKQLPVASLETVAALEDVMLIEPGRVPDPDERVACDQLRDLARRELDARGVKDRTQAG